MAKRDLQVGAFSIPQTQAQGWIEKYTAHDAPEPYAWRFYDELETGSGPNEVSGGDLLAPTLMNAPPSLTAFKSLTHARSDLEKKLRLVPLGVDLLDADDQTITRIGGLFAILDAPERDGFGMTTLSKVLHRRRPGLIPLYDRRVRRAYVSARGAPVPTKRNRSWQDFATALVRAMRHDLDQDQSLWRDWANRFGATPLRLLDIVAWSKGDE